ncbi:MAG: hypothetical protein WCO28_04885 [Bacteroidota bacterium]
MKHLIFGISILFIFIACKNNGNIIATSKLNTFVHFVDSMDQFNSNYLTDTKYAEIPFEDFFPSYRKHSLLIDSLEKAKCFNDFQKNELQTSKKKFDHIVAERLNTFIRFVDSVEKFDAYYKTTFDTIYTEIPISQNHPEMLSIDTMLIANKSVFSASQNNFGSHFSSVSYRNSFILEYMIQSALMDSIENNSCFKENQKTEIQMAKKKYNKLVEEGAKN